MDRKQLQFVLKSSPILLKGLRGSARVAGLPAKIRKQDFLKMK
jgi:hypothetical protein